ncbi:uncharacterized protein LOC123873976 [Maniola jurtina]|uniref:uncharacterized protein LOC123873976 n=1 Tax=Maniola jurtina TaxID=191418 RepID=UPI001E6880ED|nr:uncharacterized protein LOC123873976 [Maniola jurtina]
MGEILEWTNEQVIRLINSYKARGMLWDPNHDLYRVQTAKYEAWCELAELYGCEITDLRKKFNSILASHRREKAKIRMGGKSSWFAYNHLSFLPNHLSFEDASATLTKSKKKDSIAEPTEEEQEDHPEEPAEEPSSELEEYDDNGSNSPINIIIKEEPEIIAPSPQRYYRTARTSMQARINKRKLEKEKLQRLAEKKKKLLEIKQSKISKDECDSFGEYISISLRKHDERTRSMIKQAINNILFEQEMKKYNTGQYTVIYAGADVNPLIDPDDCEK